MSRAERSFCRLTYDFSPLDQASWWAALVALLINDRLLKGTGIVPTWFTGKLSDFAFMVVAPVLLATLLPKPLPGRRILACVSVVALFVAADLSQSASDAIERTAAHAGLAWRLWPDPTDLLALGILPVTVWLLRQPRSSQPRPWRRFVGASIGAMACLATSAPERYPHGPFLVNRSAAQVDVTLTWVLRQVPCDAVAELAASLTAGDLGDPHVVRLQPGQVTALDAPPKQDASAAGKCSNLPTSRGSDDACIGVLVEAGGTATLMVAPRQWEEDEAGDFVSCSGPDEPVSLCAPSLPVGRNPGADALWISGGGTSLTFGAGTRIQHAPITRSAIVATGVAPTSCRALLDRHRAETQASARCATNSDCVVARGLPLDGEPCTLYVAGAASAAKLESYERDWQNACVTNDERGCPYYVAPPKCHNGMCSAADPHDRPDAATQCRVCSYNPATQQFDLDCTFAPECQ